MTMSQTTTRPDERPNHRLKRPRRPHRRHPVWPLLQLTRLHHGGPYETPMTIPSQGSFLNTGPVRVLRIGETHVTTATLASYSL